MSVDIVFGRSEKKLLLVGKKIGCLARKIVCWKKKFVGWGKKLSVGKVVLSVEFFFGPWEKTVFSVGKSFCWLKKTMAVKIKLPVRQKKDEWNKPCGLLA